MDTTKAPTYVNPLEALEQQYEKEGQAERAGKSVKRGVVRASSLGHQPRRLMFDYFPEAFPPEPIKGRGCRTFEVGDDRHDRLRSKLSKAGMDGRIPATKDEEEEWEMPIPGTNWIIRGHPDGVLYNLHVKGVRYERALLEIKTAGSFGWREVLAGTVDAKYLLQGYANCEALKLGWIYFLYERKDTQHLAEVMVPHDPRALDHALTMASGAIHAIEGGLSPLDLALCAGEDYGWQQRAAKRGQQPITALGWRCSYCPFVAECFPAHVRWLSGGRPVCTTEECVPADATVVDMGPDIIPQPGWKLSGDAEENGDG